MRDRLTYANVMATLAMFVALGGTGYAAHQITSGDIKNRTIKGGDVRKNALGGTEINERKLRTVPNARRAQTAAGADVSKNAETANQATNSLNADVANLARDASALAGQGAAAFEKSTRVAFGRAPVNPGSSGDERVVLSWPELGVALTTTNQGPCGGDLGVSFRNTRSSGSAIDVFQDDGGPNQAVAPGGETNECGAGDPESFQATVTDPTGRALFVDCIRGNDELRCLGIRSEP